MLTWISQVKCRLDSAGEDDEFFCALGEIAIALGFEFYSFRIIVDRPSRGVDVHSRNNYPAPWRAIYPSGFPPHDAVYLHCRQSILPIGWSDALYADQPEFRSSLIEFGMNHGMSQVFHGRTGITSMFSLVRGNSAVSDNELFDKGEHLLWLANLLHNSALPRVLGRAEASRLETPVQVQSLSDREIEILRLTGQGMTSKQVAEILNVVTRTVNFHVAKSITKLGVSNKTAAVALAARAGLFDPTDPQ
jgi:LuxR family transcriptional regulator